MHYQIIPDNRIFRERHTQLPIRDECNHIKETIFLKKIQRTSADLSNRITPITDEKKLNEFSANEMFEQDDAPAYN